MYTIRDIDPELWRQVKAKAALQQTSIKQVIEDRLRAWLGDDAPPLKPRAKPRRKGV